MKFQLCQLGCRARFGVAQLAVIQRQLAEHVATLDWLSLGDRCGDQPTSHLGTQLNPPFSFGTRTNLHGWREVFGLNVARLDRGNAACLILLGTLL